MLALWAFVLTAVGSAAVDAPALRPCSESDVYAAYPKPTHDRHGHVRPAPMLIGCSELHLSGAAMSGSEAALLIRSLVFPENGAFSNESVIESIGLVRLDGIPLGDGAAAMLGAAYGQQREVPLALNLSLSLAASQITALGMADLAPILSAGAGATVTSLSLDWNEGLGDSGAAAIASALHGNRALTSLSLARCGIGDDGARALAEAFMGAHALRDVNLEGNRIGAAGAAALGGALSNRTSLEGLHLALNPIGAEGATQLGVALRHNRVLRVLSLGNCGVGDEGAVVLGAALRGNTVLHTLTMQGNAIGRRGGAALADAVRINPIALRELDLRLNALDRASADDMLDALQHGAAARHGGGLHMLMIGHNHALPAMDSGTIPPEQITPEQLADIEAVLRGRASSP